MENLGLVQVFWGNGKGKTTAALGTALRALNENLTVHLVQFMKNGANSLDKQMPGEIESLSNFKNFSCERFGSGEWVLNEKEKHLQEINLGLERLKNSLNEHNLVIADEILYAAQMNLLTEEQVLEVIKQKPKNTELILTGSHKPFQKIFDASDLVTEVRKIKHPYDKGILARKGIEY